MKKPAMLQVNTNGAWKNVAAFDVGDSTATDEVMNGAGAIATHAQGDPKFRVVATDVSPPEPLQIWSQSRKEWVKWGYS